MISSGGNIWDTATGRLHFTPGSLAFTPDGKRAFVGSINGLYLWDTTTGLEVLQTGKLGRIALSPDGRFLAIAGSRDIEILDAGAPIGAGRAGDRK
jgi:WD40 repeat protein